MPSSPPDTDKHAALFAAVEAGDVAAVQKLLAVGVPPDIRDKWNATPLIRAANAGNEDVFFVLVKAGANLDATRGYSDSVLLKAVRRNSPGRLQMVQAIVRDGIVEDDALPNAFAYACQNSGVEVVRALLAAGADPNHEYAPLWKAIEAGNREIVAALIEAGADVNARVRREEFRKNEYAGKLPVQAAQAMGRADIATMLLAAGAKLPAKTDRPSAPSSITDSWKRISNWLNRNAPEWKPLNDGASDADLAAAEKTLGFKLPDDFREMYLVHNGNDSTQIFPCRDDISFYLMPLRDVSETWKMQKELMNDGNFTDADAKASPGIQNTWWNAAWVPFAGNGGGDHFCMDLDPAAGGAKGQVIHFRHDAEERTLLAPSLREFFNDLANRLEDGELTYDPDEGIV